jgi:hypothetical protein
MHTGHTVSSFSFIDTTNEPVLSGQWLRTFEDFIVQRSRRAGAAFGVGQQWFAPLPYTTPVAELDVRPGGANLIVMRDPDGHWTAADRETHEKMGSYQGWGQCADQLEALVAKL